MKTHLLFLILCWSVAVFAADQVPAPAVAETPAAAPPQRSPADLEKLVAPIALYPDPLIATILPASVYPLEIVQAARFVKDTNNLAQLDAQPWDANVKAVARVPEVIQKMNNEISWTMELGEAFLAQDKELMDAVQRLRGKAQTVGSLKTSPQQIVTVTNVVVEKTVEEKVVVVTNTVVQIQPSNPQVVYVPQYSPTTVYAPPPPTADPAAALVTFGVGMLVGGAIANNNCDWHHGGCYYGGYHGDVDINVNRNVNVNQNANLNRNVNATAARSSASVSAASASAPTKWQPDQSRLSKSGSPTTAASARSGEARGYGSGGASGASAGARPSTAQANARPASAGASAGARPASTAAPTSRAAASPSASPSASRPSPSPSASQSRPSPSASPSSSAFSGAGSKGGDARSASSRGASSRGGGGGGGRSSGRR